MIVDVTFAPSAAVYEIPSFFGRRFSINVRLIFALFRGRRLTFAGPLRTSCLSTSPLCDGSLTFEIDPQYYRDTEIMKSFGDPKILEKDLNSKTKIFIEEIIEKLIDFKLKSI